MEYFAILVSFLLVFLRCLGMVVVVPGIFGFLGYGGVFALSFALGFGALGVSRVDVNLYEISLSTLGFAALSELAIGIAIVLPFALASESLRIAGRTIDVSRGAQFAQQISPALGEAVSPFEMLAGLSVLVLTFCCYGYQLAVSLLYKSFVVVPLYSSSQALLYLKEISAEKLLKIASLALHYGAAIAAPVIVFCFLLDLLGAFLSKTLARVNIIIEIMPLKLTLGAFIAGCVVINNSQVFVEIFQVVVGYAQ